MKKSFKIALLVLAVLLFSMALVACAKTYTVTFYDGTTKTKTEDVKSGEKVAKPTNPTKEGYKFEGWYTDSTYKTAYDFSKAVTGNLNLYAKWTAEETPPAETK